MNGFSRGFEKTAVIGAFVSGAARVAAPAAKVGWKAVGKPLYNALGGGLGTAFTGAQAYGNIKGSLGRMANPAGSMMRQSFFDPMRRV